MGKWFGGGGSSSGGGTQDNKPPRRPDPYVSGNRDDWNRRPASDGENFSSKKDKKDKK
jgi:hypothetical protein